MKIIWTINYSYNLWTVKNRPVGQKLCSTNSPAKYGKLMISGSQSGKAKRANEEVSQDEYLILSVPEGDIGERKSQLKKK